MTERTHVPRRPWCILYVIMVSLLLLSGRAHICHNASALHNRFNAMVICFIWSTVSVLLCCVLNPLPSRSGINHFCFAILHLSIFRICQTHQIFTYSQHLPYIGYYMFWDYLLNLHLHLCWLCTFLQTSYIALKFLYVVNIETMHCNVFGQKRLQLYHGNIAAKIQMCMSSVKCQVHDNRLTKS